MKLLIIFITALSTVNGQSCRSKTEIRQVFGQYLNCVKSQLDGDYRGFENEFQQHNQQSVDSCFASTLPQANSQNRCVMTRQDLQMEAWSRDGPLRECSICRTFANAAIKAILKTTEHEQACIRNEITKAVSKEADFCLKKKLGSQNFAGVPDIPDLEASSFAFKHLVIKSISDHIMIKSRLSFCEQRRPDRAQTTSSCLRNPFAGFMVKHCQLVQTCDSRIPGGCQQVFGQTRTAMCGCIDDARLDLKQRIGSIANVIKDTIDNQNFAAIGSVSTADRCVTNIKAQLITPVNDWLEVMGATMRNCLRNPPNNNLGLEAMLRVGCRKIISETKSRRGAESHRQLKIGFDFINNLIDAMVDRSKRFCSGPHCG